MYYLSILVFSKF